MSVRGAHVFSSPEPARPASNREPRRLACALTIGGLDPGGGAGIIADLRAFQAAGAFGCAVVAVLTVQSTSGLESSTPVGKIEILRQARAVIEHERVRAIKVGALGSVANVRAAGELLAIHREIASVIDPVMLPTRGRGRLLAERGVGALRTHLIPHATLVTANVPEAEALLQTCVTDVRDAREAALGLVRMGAKSALVKGGHLGGARAIDVLAVGDEIVELDAPRWHLGPIHGAGCTLASLIAGRLATRGGPCDKAALISAVRWAKKTHHALLGRAVDVGGDLRVLVP